MRGLDPKSETPPNLLGQQRPTNACKLPAGCLVMAIALALGVWAVVSGVQELRRRNERIVEQGRAARRANVSVEANPYRGNWRRGDDAERWLHGWLEAGAQ